MYLGVILLLIRRMTASFGKLRGEMLELNDGLNILQAPNETGKPTWCAFLLSMFYGVNSRERERAGFIPDKIRYAPWSGSTMSGRLDCLADGRELTLTRTTRRQTSPMGEFQAVYSGTGDHVPELTGTTCGETLLGVSREVYERSAFIRQAGLPISQDTGLERRIASLITSGEEDTSYSEATDTLKKQVNRRRHNKTGQLPALEAELQDTERQIEEAEVLARQLAEARAQAETFAHREAALAEEVIRLDRWAAAMQKQALAQAHAAAQQTEQRAAALRQRLEEDRVPENETIGRLRGAIVNLETTRKAVDKARAERDVAAKALLRAEAAVNESPFTGLTPEQAEKSPLDFPSKPRFPLWAALLLVLCAAALGTVLYFSMQNLPLAIGAACGLLGVSVLACGLFFGRKQAHWETLAAEARQQRQTWLTIQLYTVPLKPPGPRPTSAPPRRKPCTTPSPPMSRVSCWKSGVSPPPPSMLRLPTVSCGSALPSEKPWPRLKPPPRRPGCAMSCWPSKCPPLKALTIRSRCLRPEAGRPSSRNWNRSG